MKSRVKVRHLAVPVFGLPAETDGLRIAHISDLHFRGWQRVHTDARRRLTRLRYDLLAVTGDFSVRRSRWRETAKYCQEFFGRLRPPLGTYAVLGNHDDPRLAAVQGTGVRWLQDESVTLCSGRGTLCVAGTHQEASGAGRLDAALSEAGTDDPVIMLAHYPSTAYNLPAGKVHLLLSGHTHGGQIRVPLVGALWTNDRVPRSMARGLHLVGKSWLHINPGIGTSMPIRVRFNCPPEITVLELRRVGTQADDMPSRENRIAQAVALAR
jgi:predicted MPP superfamily phosphohydrolase